MPAPKFKIGDRVVPSNPGLANANTGTVQKQAGHGWVRVRWDGAVAQLGVLEKESDLALKSPAP